MRGISSHEKLKSINSHYFCPSHLINKLPKEMSLLFNKDKKAKLPHMPNPQQQRYPRSTHLLWKRHVLLEYSIQYQKAMRSAERGRFKS